MSAQSFPLYITEWQGKQSASHQKIYRQWHESETDFMYWDILGSYVSKLVITAGPHSQPLTGNQALPTPRPAPDATSGAGRGGTHSSVEDPEWQQPLGLISLTNNTRCTYIAFLKCIPEAIISMYAISRILSIHLPQCKVDIWDASFF